MGNFLSDIERFLDRFGLTASRFGDMAMNDPGFVAGLRRGRSPTLNTAARVRQWMLDYRAANRPVRRRPTPPPQESAGA
jgi:hypothetical protein